MYIYMYVCFQVCVYVYMHVCLDVHTSVCMGKAQTTETRPPPRGMYVCVYVSSQFSMSSELHSPNAFGDLLQKVLWRCNCWWFWDQRRFCLRSCQQELEAR